MKSIIYLINLDDSVGRLFSANNYLENLKIDYIRISAIDGRGKGVDDFPLVDQNRMRKFLGRNLSGGEIGCYLSHIECVKNFLATDADFCIVLEDDVATPHEFFMEILFEAIKNMPDGWHVINFGNQKNKIYSPLKNFKFDTFQTQLVKAHYFPMTTTGLCWSREGAQKFLNEAFPIFSSVDRFLRHWQTRVGHGYCFMPPLVTTTGADSDISRPVKTGGLSIQKKFEYGFKKQWQMMSDKVIAYFEKFKHE